MTEDRFREIFESLVGKIEECYMTCLFIGKETYTARDFFEKVAKEDGIHVAIHALKILSHTIEETKAKVIEDFIEKGTIPKPKS